MSPADLAKKREGLFVTGLPFFSADPLNGIGAGATGYLIFNGSRESPLFAYAPYEARLGVTAGYSTGDSAEIKLKLDMPYVAGSPWRLRVDAKFASNPNNLYFGLTEETLARLPQGTYDAYSAELARVRSGVNREPAEVADVLKHRFLEREWMLNPKLERVFFGGNWRVLVGYEIQHLSYETYEGREVDGVDPASGAPRRVLNGNSLLRAHAEDGRVHGIDGGRVSLLQLSLMYDSRDFEPDPLDGLFVELGSEFSGAAIGSEFTFTKVLLQAKHYLQVLPGTLRRTVLATRAGYGTILGSEAPFFEYQDQWTTEGSINALGGSQTLRGYKANRFLGRTVAFANVELRHRFADFDAFGQNFTLTLTPFVDLGTIGDTLVARFSALRASYGGGLRIGWNRSTVITLDVATSDEDTQLFVGFNNSY